MKKVISVLMVLSMFLVISPAMAEWATLCQKTPAGFETIQQDWINPETDGNFCHYTDHWPVDNREISLHLSDEELTTLFDNSQILCRVTNQPFSCSNLNNQCSAIKADMPSMLTPQYSWFRILVEPGFSPYSDGENFSYTIYRKIMDSANWVLLDNFTYRDTTLEVSILSQQEAADGVIISSGTYDFIVVPSGTPPENMSECVRSAEVNFVNETLDNIAVVHRDIIYKRALWWFEKEPWWSEELKCNLYLPKGDFPKPYPIILYAHGGGWTWGNGDSLENSSVETAAILLEALNRGMAVITFDYSLNPGVNWDFSPQSAWDAVENIDDLLRWLNHQQGWFFGQKNYQLLGLDPNDIAITGPSAGGHLVLMAGLLQGETDSGYYSNPPLTIKHIIVNSGPYDMSDWVPTNRYIRAMEADVTAYYYSNDLNIVKVGIEEYMLDRIYNGLDSAYQRRISKVDELWFNPEFVEKRRKLSPRSYIDRAWKLEIIQFVHGLYDSVIPHSQSLMAVRGLQNIEHPRVYLHSWEGGHMGTGIGAFRNALDIIQGK